MFLLNPIFYFYLRPAQRRASRQAFEKMKLVLPDQAGLPDAKGFAPA
jgi:hypothetical protein